VPGISRGSPIGVDGKGPRASPPVYHSSLEATRVSVGRSQVKSVSRCDDLRRGLKSPSVIALFHIRTAMIT